LSMDVAAEQEMADRLEKTLRAEDELADNMISQVRAKFNQAVAEKDPTSAAQYHKVLGGLGADTGREDKALARLRKQVEMNQEQEKLRARLVTQFRGKFKEGFRKKNRDTCRYYLKELVQLGVDVAEEHQLLSALEA